MTEETQPPQPRESGSPFRNKKDPRPSCGVLFVCPDNSTASIMAEALMKHLGGDGIRAFSAGSEPGPRVHPLAIEALKGRRIWREDLQPKSYQGFLQRDSPKMDFVIGVGERWPDGLPSNWPGNPEVIQWHITEPSREGKESENRRAFKKTLTELDRRIRLFLLILEKEAMKRVAA